MTIKVAIIGLGIMGSRMLNHMRLHEEFDPNYLWDPNLTACENAIKKDSKSTIMHSAYDAIEKADLVYLACPPTVRETYAIKAVEMGKALFLEKPFGINVIDSKKVDGNISILVNNVAHRTAWIPYHKMPRNIINDTIIV